VSRVLITGVSTRAAAESAARAGFDVTALDAFADLDQHPGVQAHALPGPFTARAAAEAARRIECDAVAYLSNFENHPAAVRALTANRMLWGNPPEILKRVRDPIAVVRALRNRGFAVPAAYVASGFGRTSASTVRLKADATMGKPADATRGKQADATRGKQTDATKEEWLVKPRASGGGHGIRPWHQGDDVPSGAYLQEYVDGIPGSVVFVAARGRAVPLGLSRQLIGDRAFGTDGFRYCGNILAPSSDTVFQQEDALVAATCELAVGVADEFGLVGLNGIDFVARDAAPYVIEINPRWCASMELVERAYGLSIFGAHARACDAGTLPDFDLIDARRRSDSAFGKAIVFAHHDITAADTCEWVSNAVDEQTHIRDVPRPGTFIRAGRPICTVFAEAANAGACYAALVARAARVYADFD